MTDQRHVGPSFLRWLDVRRNPRGLTRVGIIVGTSTDVDASYVTDEAKELTIFQFARLGGTLSQRTSLFVLPISIGEVSNAEHLLDILLPDWDAGGLKDQAQKRDYDEDKFSRLDRAASARNTPHESLRLDTFISAMGIEQIEFLRIAKYEAPLAALRSAGLFLRDCAEIEIEAEAFAHLVPSETNEIDTLLESMGFSVDTSRETRANARTHGSKHYRLRSEDYSGIGLPRVSVVVPTLNRGPYLRRTIDSILSQDYPNIECIVVDAMSTDDTLETLRAYGGKVLVVTEPDTGPFEAINKGWQLSSGSILAWLNADDFYEPSAVRRAVAALESAPDVSVVHGSCGMTDVGGNLKYLMPTPQWDFGLSLLHCDHIIYQSTAFIRRDAVRRAGWLHPTWAHDHELWLRISLSGGRFRGVPFHLASSRLDQPDIYRRLPDRYAPPKIDLVRRTFQLNSLPPDLQPLRRRAMSNAHARGIDYLHLRYPRHWWWGMRCLALSLTSDPTNAGNVLRDVFRRIVWRLHRHW